MLIEWPYSRVQKAYTQTRKLVKRKKVPSTHTIDQNAQFEFQQVTICSFRFAFERFGESVAKARNGIKREKVQKVFRGFLVVGEGIYYERKVSLVGCVGTRSIRVIGRLEIVRLVSEKRGSR